VIRYRMAVKTGMLGVSVREMKALTEDGDSDTEWYNVDMLCVLSV